MWNRIIFFTHYSQRNVCVLITNQKYNIVFPYIQVCNSKVHSLIFFFQVCYVCIQSSKHTSSGILKILSAINCHKPSLLQMTHINQEDGTLAASLTDTLSCVSRNIWIVSKATSQIKWLNLWSTVCFWITMTIPNLHKRSPIYKI